MSKGNTFENDVLNYTFIKTAFGWAANANFFIGLHTADPGEAGDQLTSEATYTSYARVAVLRTVGGWTVSGAVASNATLIQFPQCSGGTNTITHVCIGTVVGPGAGQIVYSGVLNANLSVSNLIQPQFAIGALTVTED